MDPLMNLWCHTKIVKHCAKRETDGSIVVAFSLSKRVVRGD